MKLFRSLTALMLSVLLVFAAGSALAASEMPSFKIEAPEIPIPGGALGQLKVTPNVPGFLTVTLKDASGADVMTLFPFREIHTKLNELRFSTITESGEPLAEGTYTFVASMVDEYGNASAEVTGSLAIGASIMSNDQDAPADEEAADEQAHTQPQTGVKPSSQKPARPSSGRKPAQSAGDKVVYEQPETKMGPEGFEIGVGVSDVVPQENAGYWALDASASDADIWAAITRTMVGVDAGETDAAYIYDSTEEGRDRIGTVSGISQGLNVIKDLGDGWSLVEAFRNEDGAFVRGYIRTSKLRVVDPNTTYGIVIDKAAQTLTVYKDGERLGSCPVTTGLPSSKSLHRETPAGEYITVTRRGTTEYYGMGYSKYTIRISGSYHLCEIPTDRKNGKNFDLLEDKLGTKATRGNICLPHDASTDGGINAEWIWDMTDKNKKVKVLIFDDKPRTDVPVGN